MRSWGTLVISVALMTPAAIACGGANDGSSSSRGRTPSQLAQGMEGAEPVDDQGRCDTEAPDREVSEYDTTGDARPDVRRVYRRVGRPPLIRLILACREQDLNGDGTKDIVRFYNDEGRPIREEADRDFNGQMDSITYYQAGRVVRQELDTTGNGRVDTKLFYERGNLVRAERDIAGRSTPTQWRPDRWEYFEDGRMVRMGTDLDGDGQVDRWDRNAEHYERRRAQEEAEAAEAEAEAAADEMAEAAEAAEAGG